MDREKVLQGRKITPTDIELVQRLLADHSSWGRTRLSEELCRLWDWRSPSGQWKEMACRTLLLKLERIGEIILPPRKRIPTNEFRNRQLELVPHENGAIKESLQELRPLQITLVFPRTKDYGLFQCLLSRYHYLGHRNFVGETLRYLVRDKMERPISCILFGSAAWKTAPRDSFIGWSPEVCQRRLTWITNNRRFLILPWVKVPHLASHILAQIASRIQVDWIEKYYHPVFLLETFVDRERFRGTCYKAANWILLGKTKGRSRQDRYNQLQVPIKDIYVYPLTRHFREELKNGADA